MDLLHKKKIFKRDSNSESQNVHNRLFSQQLRLSKTSSQVSLILTKDDYLVLVQANKRQKVCQLSLQLRFLVKEEKQPEKLPSIFKLIFEMDDTPLVEFYSNDVATEEWVIHLRDKISMLDYQMFYDLDKLMGQGSFGSVYIAKRKSDNTLFAAKAFFKKLLYANDAKGRQQIDNEIGIMRKLKHQNLVNLHEVYENKGQVYLIIDLARGGTLASSLAQFKAPIPFLAAKVILHQIMEGVNYMHENGIMHRDLKPSNILFRTPLPIKKFGLENVGNNIMVSDFGIASEVKDRLNVYQFCGSPGYMAPEVFETEIDPSKTYTEKCDVFSLGCIFYEMLVGKMLFSAPTNEAQRKLNMQCKVDYQQMLKDLNNSNSLTTLFQRILSKNPDDRPTIKQLIQSRTLQVEYTEEGVPVFKDFNRPKSSPPKRHSVIFTQEDKKPLFGPLRMLQSIQEEKKDNKPLNGSAKKDHMSEKQEQVLSKEDILTSRSKLKTVELFLIANLKKAQTSIVQTQTQNPVIQRRGSSDLQKSQSTRIIEIKQFQTIKKKP